MDIGAVRANFGKAGDVSRPRGRVASLDGLRGCLAAFVCLAHYEVSLGHPDLIPYAKSSVMMFFFISAYALTVSWDGRYGRFLLKRFLRLWPAYAISIAIAGSLSCQGAPWHDYFWVPFRPSQTGQFASPVVWSLYIEVYASLAMPLIIFVGSRLSVAVVTCLVLTLLRPFSEDLYFGLFFVAGSCAARWRFDFAPLNSRFCQALGAISYSLYLTHTLVIAFCKFHWPEHWAYLAPPVCIVVACVFWAVVEAPSQFLSRRIPRWLAPGAARRFAKLFRLRADDLTVFSAPAYLATEERAK
jgi:peptidoglycan/LPS O-acetylase OafA/YrhL